MASVTLERLTKTYAGGQLRAVNELLVATYLAYAADGSAEALPSHTQVPVFPLSAV